MGDVDVPTGGEDDEDPDDVVDVFVGGGGGDGDDRYEVEAAEYSDGRPPITPLEENDGCTEAAAASPCESDEDSCRCDIASFRVTESISRPGIAGPPSFPFGRRGSRYIFKPELTFLAAAARNTLYDNPCHLPFYLV